MFITRKTNSKLHKKSKLIYILIRTVAVLYTAKKKTFLNSFISRNKSNKDFTKTSRVFQFVNYLKVVFTNK